MKGLKKQKCNIIQSSIQTKCLCNGRLPPTYDLLDRPFSWS